MAKPKINEEEFNNFMHRVTEINGIVKKLSSTNKDLNHMGLEEADRYLSDSKFENDIEVDEEMIKLHFKEDKTLINKIIEEKPKNENEMSKEAFMREVERDAKQRYEDKKIRREKSETIKIQANKAFRRGEYEKALSLYNKAIDLIRDSCVLYTNRALTYMNLGFYDKALKDCDTAHRINEDSLKAWLYKAKCHFMLKDHKASDECIKEAYKKNVEHKEIIDDFVQEFKKN